MGSSRSLAILACACALVLAIPPAVAEPVYPRTSQRGDNALTIGHLFAIDSLNPFIGFSNEAYLFYSLVYDYLFSLDEQQNYVPNIALSSATPDGGRTWVYQIRQGVKWHDGNDLNASDVAFTINYNIQNFWLLWAYEPYVNQVIQCPVGQTTGCGAQVTGLWEVTISFERPFSPGSAAIVVPILQRAQWEGVTAPEAQYSYPNRNPIGTGPYMADPDIYNQWLNGNPIVLHRNPSYHFGAPAVERIVFRLFSDENALVAALIRGEIDVAALSAAGYDAVDSANIAGIDLQEGLTVIQYWIDLGITQLNHPGVNIRLNPARFDLAVRQAMAHATDKQFILQQFYRGKGALGSTLVSPVSLEWHYEPTAEAFDYNLTKAAQILESAGYVVDTGTGLRKAASAKVLDIYCSPENLARGCQTQVTVPQNQDLKFTMVTRVEAPEERQVAEFLKQTWAQIGIELTITTEEEITMNVDVYGGEFDTYIWWWSADADPNYILAIQSNFTLNGWSDNYYDNETYNNFYLAQLSAIDANQRRQYVFDAQRVHYLGAAFIILVYPYFQYAWWTDEYAGWGDMNAEPGRQLGAFWGKHPLFLELMPIPGTNFFTSNVVLIAVAGAGAAVAAVAIVFFLVSRGRQKREEALPELPPVPPPPRT